MLFRSSEIIAYQDGAFWSTQHSRQERRGSSHKLLDFSLSESGLHGRLQQTSHRRLVPLETAGGPWDASLAVPYSFYTRSPGVLLLACNEES